MSIKVKVSVGLKRIPCHSCLSWTLKSGMTKYQPRHGMSRTVFRSILIFSVPFSFFSAGSWTVAHVLFVGGTKARGSSVPCMARLAGSEKDIIFCMHR